MKYLQSLASSSNMPYENITLDVGAAINAYKFLWANQTSFENVVIHLGDFHFMKENFQVISLFLLFYFLAVFSDIRPTAIHSAINKRIIVDFK